MTDLFLDQNPPQQDVIFPTHTILHPNIDGVGITDVQDTPKSLCNRIQAKEAIQRHPICLKYADYDYILDEI